MFGLYVDSSSTHENRAYVDKSPFSQVRTIYRSHNHCETKSQGDRSEKTEGQAQIAGMSIIEQNRFTFPFHRRPAEPPTVSTRGHAARAHGRRYRLITLIPGRRSRGLDPRNRLPFIPVSSPFRVLSRVSRAPFLNARPAVSPTPFPGPRTRHTPIRFSRSPTTRPHPPTRSLRWPFRSSKRTSVVKNC